MHHGLRNMQRRITNKYVILLKSIIEIFMLAKMGKKECTELHFYFKAPA